MPFGHFPRASASLVFLLALGGLVGGCGGEEKPAPVTVYAAKSLQGVLSQIATAWRGESGRDVAFEFDDTARLVPKVLEGAPADAFFGDDEGGMDRLAAGGRVLASSRAVVVRNERVVYPAAAIRGAKHEEAGAAFVAYCRGPLAQEIFRQFGFQPAAR